MGPFGTKAQKRSGERARFGVVAVDPAVASLSTKALHVRPRMDEKRIEHRAYIRRHGDDMPAVKNWKWQPRAPAAPRS